MGKCNFKSPRSRGYEPHTLTQEAVESARRSTKRRNSTCGCVGGLVGFYPVTASLTWCNRFCTT